MSLGEIASATVAINGAWFRVYIDPDRDPKPTDYDCYSPADMEAWVRDEWRFVGVTVALRDHPDIRTSLWGVEWGSAPEFEVDISRIINDYPVPDMVAELRAQLVKILAEWRE